MTRQQSSDEDADTLLADDAAPPARATRESSPLRVGESVGRYTILERLGAGGMGVVHAAHDPTLDRKVALKVLHATSRDSAAQARARLKREARALAKLHHPNVVTVYEVGMVAGHVFLAMELVDGPSLNDWHKSGETRDWRRVIDIYLAAGRGLSAAHAAGLVHRDFKPANVLLGRDGRVVVTDFGLARLTSSGTPLPADASVPGSPVWGLDLDELRTLDTRPIEREAREPAGDLAHDPAGDLAYDPTAIGDPAGQPVQRRITDSQADTELRGPDVRPISRARAAAPGPDAPGPDAQDPDPSVEQLTRTGMVLGTPAYMAPEQHEGEAVDARTDQFSFCVSLHESLYGIRPFAGATPRELCEAIRAGRIAEPPRGSAVPQRVRRVLLRGLRADPDERFPAMHALLDALDQAARPRALRLATRAGLGVLAAAAALGLALLLGRARPAATQAACAVDLAGAWDRDVAAAVRAALSQRPDGEEIFTQVAGHLDADEAAWEQARGRICAATGDDEAPAASAGQFHHRMGCLLDYRDQMASLTELLRAGDERASAFAIGAARALPDPARCVSLTPQSAAFALPRDPSLRAEVARLRADLARTATAYQTASFERATELADEVLTAARAIGDHYLEAAALYWRGQGRAMRYDRAGVDEDITEAVLIAEEQGYADLHARALVTMAAFRVLDPAMPHDDMHDLLRRAQAAVDRMGDAGEVGGWLALIEGYHDARYGDTERANGAFARARALFQQAGNRFKAARVDAYWGMSLYAHGQQRLAEGRLAAGLAVLGEDLEALPYEIVCGLELAMRAAERLERYQDARRIHELLDRKCTHHVRPPPPGPARAIRGRVRDAAGQPVAGALVMADRGLSGNGRYALDSLNPHTAVTTTTDAQGGFTLDRVSDEPLVLVAEAEAGRSFPVAVGAGPRADVVVEVRPYGSVRGRLEGHGDHTHPGRERMIALVAATPDAPYRSALAVPVRLDGTFSVERLAAGRYYLGVSDSQRDPIHVTAGRWQPVLAPVGAPMGAPMGVINVPPAREVEVTVPAAALAAGAPTTALAVQVRNRFEGDLPLAHVWVLPGKDAPRSLAELHGRWYDGVTPLHLAVATPARLPRDGAAADERAYRFEDLPAGDLVACVVPLSSSTPYVAWLGYPLDLDLYCRPVTPAEQRTGQPVTIEVEPMKRRP